MPRVVTRAEVRELIRARADAVNDQDWGDAAVNALVNGGLAYLWDDLVMAAPPAYYSRDATPFSTVAGQVSYPSVLPADFYKIETVQVATGSGDTRRTLDQFQPDMRSYCIPPQSASTIHVEYVPNAPVLTADSGAGGTFDGVNGWEEVVALWGAIRILTKKGLSTQQLERLFDRERSRVLRVYQRDAGSAPQMTRTRERYYGLDPYTSLVTHYRLREGALEIYSRRVAAI